LNPLRLRATGGGMASGKYRFFAMCLFLPLFFIILPGGCSKEDLWDRFNPGSVSDVIVTAVSSTPTSLDLAWDVPSGEDIVSVAISWTDGTTSQDDASTAQTYSITGLTSGTEYEITITAVDKYGIKSPGVKMTFLWNGSTSEAHWIYSADDMNAVRGGVTGYDDWDPGDTYYLMADIDLSAYAAGSGWDPIGDDLTPFTGGFYGNGHTISGLAISRSGENYVGLFGYSTGVIKKVNLDSVSVTGQIYTAALAGYNAGIVESVTISGLIIGSDMLGMLAGYNDSNITDCFSSGVISGTNGNNGGLVGYSVGLITDCGSSCVVTDSGSSNCTGGLVGRNTGTIGLSYATGNVSGESEIGGLVGYNEGSISDSHAAGNATGSDDYVGGLIGNNVNSTTGTITIQNCYSTGKIEGNEWVGGLIGQNENTSTGIISILNCYHETGSVTATGNNTGGLVGYNYNSGSGGISISACRASGNVLGVSSTGGLVGNNTNSTTGSMSITGSWYNGASVTGSSDNVGGLIGVFSGSLSLTGCYSTGDVSGGNDFTGGLIGYTFFSVPTPSFVLIDSCSSSGNVSGNGSTGGLVGMLGNGNSGSITVTGCYHITGTVSGTGSNTGGLIGYNSNSSGTLTISNSYHTTGNVTGTSYTGGLIGRNSNSDISGCYSTGNVTGTNSNIGGLVGESTGSDISGCHATGSVDATGYAYVGGLVGSLFSGSLSSCYATGYVLGNGGVGGLVGVFNVSAGVSISLCYATGSVTGSGNYVGGFIGQLLGTSGFTIENCYSRGSVDGASNVGGFVGGGSSTGSIQYCYATGVVTGTAPIGGLAGNASGATVSDCYYDANTGWTAAPGTVTDHDLMLEPGTYLPPWPGWGTGYIWSIGGSTNEGYPYLTALVP
jgi:hypothetical protein